MSEFWTYVWVYTAGIAIVPWLIGTLLGASLTPVAFAAALAVERVRAKKRLALGDQEQMSGQHGAEPRAFQTSDLRNRLVLTCAILPLAMIVAMLINAFFWAWTLLATSSVLCAIWWLRLRILGVRHAEVYAITLWLAPRIVWAVYVLVYSALTDGRMYDFYASGTADPDGPFAHVFGGTVVFAVALALTVLIALVALFAVSRDFPAFVPTTVIAMVLPCVVYFWFVEPFGFTHVGFTLMVVGYVISRETRRMNYPRAIPRIVPAIASIVIAVATAAALALLVTDLIQNVSRGGGVLPITFFVLMQIIVVSCLGSLALVLAAVTNSDLRYGAVSLGIGSLLLFTWTHNIASFGDDFDGWTTSNWLTTSVVLGAVLLLMWRVYGPGAVASRRQDESQDHADTTTSVPARLTQSTDG